MRLKRRASAAVLLTGYQRHELVVGPDLACAMAGHPERESMFESERHRRAAWEAHRDELIRAELAAARDTAGQRPWAFWVYEVERADLTYADDELEVERVRVLAEGGYLSRAEVAELRERARAARERVETGAERYTAVPDPDYPDRSLAEIGEILP